MPTTEKGTVTLPIYIFDGRAFSTVETPIIQEVPLQLFLNGHHLATIACTGLHMKELAVGYLKSEGLIKDRADIEDIRIDGDNAAIHVYTAGGTAVDWSIRSFGGRIASSGARTRFAGDPPVNAFRKQDARSWSPEQILSLMDRFVDLCRLHAVTRGTHGAAITDGKDILVVREDIGRHNAIDMLTGHALLKGWDCADKAVLRTGRVSTEIVSKIMHMGVTVVASLSIPTDRAVSLAREAGITLVGAIRGRSMQVYTHERRVRL